MLEYLCSFTKCKETGIMITDPSSEIPAGESSERFGTGLKNAFIIEVLAALFVCALWGVYIT